MTPLVGDRVHVTVDDAMENKQDRGAQTGAMIAEIYPRRNALIRPAMANLHVMFVVAAAKDPDPSLRFLDKLLCILEYQEIEPVLIVTKADLDAHRAEQMRTKYEKCGFTVFVTDAETAAEDARIVAYLETFDEHTIAAFCGASGVGKSTLMNRLFPHLDLETGEISEKIARGKHTTRAVHLFSLEHCSGGRYHGYLADTPGFSMLDFVRFDFFSVEELPYTFREFVPLIGQCRYTKCTHTKEEGCAILSAVAEKTVPKSRHTSYLELYDVLKDKKEWMKE
jgi:ribosome biogenesis GTPase